MQSPSSQRNWLGEIHATKHNLKVHTMPHIQQKIEFFFRTMPGAYNSGTKNDDGFDI